MNSLVWWRMFRTHCVVVFCLLFMRNGHVVGNAQLDSWSSCCGAVCLRVASEFVGRQAKLADLRKLVRPNAEGQTTLADIYDAGKELGLYCAGLRMPARRIETCTVPLIAHSPPNHFLVFVGLGSGRGVLMVDPPYAPRIVSVSELQKQSEWNVVAISAAPLLLNLPADWIANLPSQQQVVLGLQFERTSWDFGVVGVTQELRHEFSFKNVTDKGVRLSDVRVSCGCMKIVNASQFVDAGEEGVIEVVIDPAKRRGVVREWIIGTCESDVDNSAKFILRIAFDVSKRGELIIDPPHIEMPELSEGSQVSTIAKIRRVGNDSVHLKSIHSSSALIKAEVLEQYDSEAESVRVRISMTGTGPIGSFEHKVVFETADVDHPRVALRLFGEVVPCIRALPDQLFLGSFSKNVDLIPIVVLNSTQEKQFSVISASVDIPGILVEASPVRPASTNWVLRFRTHSSLTSGVKRGVVTVTTDDSNNPILTIPVVGLAK